ncbi:hypothetical protein B5M47_01890 [candidate division CPR3 bacterium 4484_211]|uniref:Probable serine hydroxymethyltransferase n=1 Tax=candidate division CPR3 bacterium 4484_211 TaxID=1968527 RepID=A0A1W9NY66_UNCC3|nr:MAG: hypothetical protein B5M47_01890 [candidate division CPR3 bacterium 4484_211]
MDIRIIPNFKMDTEMISLIQKEQERQRCQLRLIPSENYASREVLSAVGSVLMNKYSEGQAFRRYYQGNFIIDQIEALVKKRALKAFGLDSDKWGVNVQAVAGSIANLAVYLGLLKPGDKLLSLYLYEGGHLSHGWRLPSGKAVSFTAAFFQTSYYHVDLQTQLLDYEAVEKRALEERPAMIITGGTSYPREIDYGKMRRIADEVGALYLADIAHEAGLVAAGVNQSPFPYAHVVTMTTRKTLRGPVGALIFARREFIDRINQAVFPGLQGGPQNHSIAGIGVALHEAMRPEFKEYAVGVVANAQKLAKGLMSKGYEIVSGGTDKHLMVVDLRNKGIGGKEAALALEKANIIVNKQAVPGETSRFWAPSGIRLGTPALTSRGMREKEMEQVALFIDEALRNYQNVAVLRRIGREVRDFAFQFPAPGISG